MYQKTILSYAVHIYVLLFFLVYTANALDVGGDVSGHWTMDDSPVHVTENATVQEGEELIIDPGVIILFARDTRLGNSGLITAIGTQEDSIIFTADEDDPESGYWIGIGYWGDEGSVLRNCIIEYAQTGIDLHSGEIGFSTIRFMSENGVVMSEDRNEPFPRVHNCDIYEVFDRTYGFGILTFHGYGIADHNLVTNCRVGLVGTTWDYGYYAHNTVAFNDIGVRFWASTNTVATHNILYNNNSTGFSERNDQYFNCYFGNMNNDGENHLLGDLDRQNANDDACDAHFNINLDPLFLDPENGDFRLHPDSPCIDAGDPDGEPDPDGSPLDIGAIPFDHDVQDPERIVINLAENWNLVSSYIDPLIADIPFLFTALVENENILLVKDGDGSFYSPPFGFNNIPFWDYHQGYQVKTVEEGELTFLGELVPADTPINLHENWNITAYFPEEEVEAPDAFANISDQLLMAKDGDGHFYAPEHNFNNIPPLHRGAGYQVKVSEEVELIWNVEGEGLASVSYEELNLSHFIQVIHSDKNMSILVTNLPEEGEIGAFTDSGICVGATAFNNDDSVGLAVWGDDESTEELDGLKEGEVFNLKLWSSIINTEVDLEPEGSELVYETNGFTVIEATIQPAIPDQYYLSQNYPNPFNSTTFLPYGLPEAAQLSICIYDISGRLVETLVDNYLDAGYHTTTWEASTVATGVYLVKMETASLSSVHKLIVVR